MLSYDDVLAMCHFSEEEILAIAEHEHVPLIVAVEIAEYLLLTPDGIPKVRRIIIEDIEMARSSKNNEKVARLEMVLKHFIATHPERSEEPLEKINAI